MCIPYTDYSHTNSRITVTHTYVYIKCIICIYMHYCHAYICIYKMYNMHMCALLSRIYIHAHVHNNN